MKQEIEKTLAVLIGQPLSDIQRYAGCQKFEFGEQRPHINHKGDSVTLGDWGLVVSCDWRVTGPEGEVISFDDFGPGNERRDENGPAFHELLKTNPPSVETIQADDKGGLIFELTDGFVLQVMPERESETKRWAMYAEMRERLLEDGELWRFMPKEEKAPHFVVTTNGIYDPEHAYELFAQIFYNEYVAVQALLNQGVALQNNPNEGAEGQSALAFAAIESETDMVRLLLKNGASEGEALPMLAAARGGRIETVRLFFEMGGDVNQRDEIGWTPLMEAASWGEMEVVRFLVENGADVMLRTQKGYTALYVAQQGKQAEVAKYLRAHGATL